MRSLIVNDKRIINPEKEKRLTEQANVIRECRGYKKDVNKEKEKGDK